MTGASRGIGSAIVRRLGAEGAAVAVHYARDDSAAFDTVAAIGELGFEAFTVKAEFGSEDDIQALLESLGERLADRPIDVLVNNAGVGTSSFESTTFEEFDTRSP